MGFHSVREYLSAYTWDLAIGHYDERIIVNGIDWNNLNIVHNPYRKKWFADPFILQEDSDSIHLLVEEFDFDVKKGRIARIVISKKSYSIVECKIILELDTHLSFPAIYRIGGMVYVHPENSASGKSTIYRYDQVEDKLVDPIVLVTKPLTDAVIIKNKDEYLMYTTCLPHNGGPILSIYQSRAITKPFEATDSINYENKTARMAGSMLFTKQGMIRPAQDCTHDYGEAVLFYKEMRIIGEIRPPKNGRFAGAHTFNTLSDTFVIDLKKYTHLHMRRMVKKILCRL